MVSPTRYDVIVVGAGPAGSTAAYRLARAGASVLVLERARFPRDKPCGGGLTSRAVRLLPFPVDAVVEDSVSCLEVSLRQARRFERRSRSPLALMTQRRLLDAYLAERASEAGAEVRDGCRATGVSASSSGTEVTVEGERLQGRVLLGADGINGITAKALGLGRDDHGVALEANVPYDAARRARYRGRIVLELAIVPGGYGWVFPKGDHFNIGVGGWKEEAPRLRQRLGEFSAAHGIATDELEGTRGYRLPLRNPGAPLARGAAAVIGDAAGLVDPLTGDGIYEAFGSGKLAAEAALDVLAGRAETMAPYEPAVTRAYARLHAASWKLKWAIDRFPRLSYELVRMPIVWRSIEKVVQGDLGSPSEERGLARVPLRLLDALGRASSRPSEGPRTR